MHLNLDLKGDEENIFKILEILNKPLNHYFEELSYGLRLMYLPKPEQIGDDHDIMKNSIDQGDKIQLAFIVGQLEQFLALKQNSPNVANQFLEESLNSVTNRLNTADNQYEIDLLEELRSSLQDNLDFPMGDVDFDKYEARISVIKKIIQGEGEYFLDESDTFANQQLAVHIKDMILDNVLLGARTEDELRLLIERKVFEMQKFVSESPDPSLTVEFLGETITFIGEEILDPDRFLQTARQRIKNFFLRNKAFFIVEKVEEIVSNGAEEIKIVKKFLTNPIPVSTSEQSLFELLGRENKIS